MKEKNKIKKYVISSGRVLPRRATRSKMDALKTSTIMAGNSNDSLKSQKRKKIASEDAFELTLESLL